MESFVKLNWFLYLHFTTVKAGVFIVLTVETELVFIIETFDNHIFFCKGKMHKVFSLSHSVKNDVTVITAEASVFPGTKTCKKKLKKLVGTFRVFLKYLTIVFNIFLFYMINHCLMFLDYLVFALSFT